MFLGFGGSCPAHLEGLILGVSRLGEGEVSPKMPRNRLNPKKNHAPNLGSFSGS